MKLQKITLFLAALEKGKLTENIPSIDLVRDIWTINNENKRLQTVLLISIVDPSRADFFPLSLKNPYE